MSRIRSRKAFVSPVEQARMRKTHHNDKAGESPAVARLRARLAGVRV